MIPYDQLIPMTEYRIETQYYTIQGIYCHTIIANSEPLIIMRIGDEYRSFLSYDRFYLNVKDVVLEDKEVI